MTACKLFLQNVYKFDCLKKPNRQYVFYEQKRNSMLYLFCKIADLLVDKYKSGSKSMKIKQTNLFKE